MRPGDRLSKWIPWAVVVPWALWALVRIVGLDSTAALVAIIGLTPVAAATALIPIVVALAVGVRSAAVVAGIVAAVLITLVLPRMFGGPTEAVGSGGPTVRVLSANMMLGEGSPESLMDLVEEVEPDVLSVEELTPDLARQLDRLGLKEQLPHRNLAAEPGSQGSGLYSRVPMNGRRVSELPGGFPLVTGVIAMPGAAPIEVTSVHTVPPTVDGWTEDLDALPSAPEGGEAVLLGDFNATLDHAPVPGLARPRI